jgi:hypothetical protein
MDIDKHRESLVKYCYDISKVGFAVTVLNPALSQTRRWLDVVLGLGVTLMFFALAIRFEKGMRP